MKRFSYLFGAIALASMVSCSSDEIVSSKDDGATLSKQSISFAPLATNVTRSTVYSTTSMFTNFRVVGMWQDPVTEAYIDGDHYATAAADGVDQVWTTAPAANGLYQKFANIHAGSTLAGLEIVSSGTGWDYKNQSEIEYWPYSATKDANDKITGYNCLALNFRAVTPANTKLDLSGATPAAFAYETPDVADMVDICYAEATGKTVTDAPVQMQFHHLLSQVVFKAKKASNYVVDIKDITINGIKTKVDGYPYAQFKTSGICLSGVDNVNLTVNKQFKGFTSASYKSIPDQEAKDSPAEMTPSGQELLLLPQEISKWVPDGTTKATDAANAAAGWISITYRAKTSEATTWATSQENDGFKTVYFPITVKWASGKKYIYTLLFGGVTNPDDPENPDPDDPNNPDPDNPYDEDGHPEAPSVPITFTADVDDWAESIVDVDF